VFFLVLGSIGIFSSSISILVASDSRVSNLDIAIVIVFVVSTLNAFVAAWSIERLNTMTEYLRLIANK